MSFKEHTKYYAIFAKGYQHFTAGKYKEAAELAKHAYSKVPIEIYYHMAKMLITLEKVKMINQLKKSGKLKDLNVDSIYSNGEHNVRRYAQSAVKETLVYGTRSMAKVYEDSKDYQSAKNLYTAALAERDFINKDFMGFVLSGLMGNPTDEHVKRCQKKIQEEKDKDNKDKDNKDNKDKGNNKGEPSKPRQKLQLRKRKVDDLTNKDDDNSSKKSSR